MDDELTNEEIDTIVKDWLSKRAYDKAYHAENRTNEEYKESARQRSRLWYENNREKKEAYYDAHRELRQAQQNFRYWFSQGFPQEFKRRFPDRFEMLVKVGFIPKEACD